MNIELQNFVFDNPGRLELINYQPKTSIPAKKLMCIETTHLN